jgi:UDP-glucose 4-epimerase
VRLLVTGAAGFLGSHLSERLVADGHHVTGIDDLSTGKLAQLAQARRSKGFGFHRFDVTSEDLKDLVAHDRPDVVLHLAAPLKTADALTSARVTVGGTVNLLDACVATGVQRVVFASTGQVYGNPAVLPVGERAAVRPLSPYAASKVAAEAYLATYPIRTVSLRLGNVYGPRQQPPGVALLFARALRDGTRSTIHGAGDSTRDYVYVEDAVDAFLRCLGGKGDGRRFNIGTGEGTSLRRLHTLVAEALGVPDAPEFAPAHRGPSALALESGAARRTLGWEPVVGIQEGLARTLSWMAETPGQH